MADQIRNLAELLAALDVEDVHTAEGTIDTDTDVMVSDVGVELRVGRAYNLLVFPFTLDELDAFIAETEEEINSTPLDEV